MILDYRNAKGFHEYSASTCLFYSFKICYVLVFYKKTLKNKSWLSAIKRDIQNGKCMVDNKKL